MALKWGADCSNWQGDLRDRLQADQPSFVIVRASTESDWHRAVARMQMLQARDFGALVEVYEWCYWANDPRPFTNDVIDVAEAAGVPFRYVWLDIEERNGGHDPNHNVWWLGEAISTIQVRGYKPGIYTSPGMWAELCGNTTDCAYLPLWHANPDGDASEPNWGAGDSEYGGWSRPAIKQWRWQPIDYNVADAALWEDTPEPAPPTPPAPDPCTVMRSELQAIVSAHPYRAPSRKKLAKLLA